ncbi:MAG: GMC family oxidoreductase [Halobacteriovoraceae bacterium]|jgi:choline dehydrogenase-like flavoprotein|nr:GMC family oxidoreductase [Halobacteriovoraceae bacterium]MBT5093433.1 GMC family oxidoreductase [Halobacteriovoraceae bacterium]
MSFADPYQGKKWSILDASAFTENKTLEADIIIIGSGSGGGVCAEELSAKGYRVILVEEGPLKTSSDFKMLESEAYPELYQESAARLTKDKGIKILQGRNVGGGTTINWTTSFRTPPETLSHWRDKYQLENFTEEKLRRYFEKAERRVNIEKWQVEANQNNLKLKMGMEKLGLTAGVISRNVKDCYNLGYCGMGCPTNAKQSMLVTTIPAALENGATLIHHLNAFRLNFSGQKIAGLECRARDRRGNGYTGITLKLQAKHYILSGGAIGTPALLLRSNAPDPYDLLGKRTFLHPVSLSGALFKDPIEAYAGAPQVIYSDHFIYHPSQNMQESPGFKLEVPPIHPVILAGTAPFHGLKNRELMLNLNHFQTIISLIRDGFDERSVGGQVYLKGDGFAALDYPISDYLWRGIEKSYLAMAEIQFAAGAEKVFPLHNDAEFYQSWAQAKTAIPSLSKKILKAKLVSAHVMGGCPMHNSPSKGVLDQNSRHHHIENLSIIDGSCFPTSVGANPMQSILALAYRQVEILASAL